MSLPPSPLRTLAALLPVMTLARLLPVPAMAAAPVRVRFSTLLPRVKVTEASTSVDAGAGALDGAVESAVDDIGVVAGTAGHDVIAETAVEAVVAAAGRAACHCRRARAGYWRRCCR